jgi:putative sigma-54 modulation protein
MAELLLPCVCIRPSDSSDQSSIPQIKIIMPTSPLIAPTSFAIGTKLIVRGIHLELTEAMKISINTKAERLFRHEPRILRIRIDVDRDHRGSVRLFTAKGHIEIAGPDLQASVKSEDAYKAVDLLIDKLDRMLRRRVTALQSGRATDDIRNHPAEAL